MAQLCSSELAKGLKSGKLAENRHAVYLLYGMEAARVKSAANMIKQAVVQQLGGEQNYFRYIKPGSGGDEPGIGDITASLNTVSMFGGGKLVWIGPLENLDKANSVALLSYIQNPNMESTLLITVVFPKDNAKALKVFENTAFVKTVSGIDSCAVVKFAPPSRSELGKWLKGRARSCNLEFDNHAEELLFELCDNDLDRLDGEVEKLASYAGANHKVTVEDVEVVVGNYQADKIWDLTRAFGRQDIVKSEAALANLLKHNVPAQMILKMLGKEIGRISAALDARTSGLDFSAYSSELGDNPYTVKEAWSAGKIWTRDQVKNCLKNVLKANMDMMRGGVSAETALYGLLIATCGKSS